MTHAVTTSGILCYKVLLPRFHRVLCAYPDSGLSVFAVRDRQGCHRVLPRYLNLILHFNEENKIHQVSSSSSGLFERYRRRMNSDGDLIIDRHSSHRMREVAAAARPAHLQANFPTNSNTSVTQNPCIFCLYRFK